MSHTPVAPPLWRTPGSCARSRSQAAAQVQCQVFPWRSKSSPGWEMRTILPFGVRFEVASHGTHSIELTTENDIYGVPILINPAPWPTCCWRRRPPVRVLRPRPFGRTRVTSL